jgi:hypothetical protein
VLGGREVVSRSSGSLFALAAVLALLLAAPAQASHVRCGDVITQDTTLDSDLLDCPGSGVVIGADGITLDLNGHVVDGVQFVPLWDRVSASGRRPDDGGRHS